VVALVCNPSTWGNRCVPENACWTMILSKYILRILSIGLVFNPLRNKFLPYHFAVCILHIITMNKFCVSWYRQGYKPVRSESGTLNGLKQWGFISKSLYICSFGWRWGSLCICRSMEWFLSFLIS
jgi:hypothetical protein